MTDRPRRARVGRDTEGHPVGCAIFLTVRQLRDLGLDLETTDTIEYIVVDGDFQLQEQYSSDQQRTRENHGTVDESRGETAND